MKKCSKCNESKELSNFYRSTQTKDGKYPVCKKCVSEISKSKYKETYEKNREKQLKWYANRTIQNRNMQINKLNKKPIICMICRKPIICNEYNYRTYSRIKTCGESCRQKLHRKESPKYKIRAKKELIKKNLEYHKNKVLYEPRPDKCRACGKTYLKIMEKQLYCSERCNINTYRNRKYHNDIRFKIEINLRSSLSGRVRKYKKLEKKRKIGKFDDLIGCSVDKLMNHLESSFKDGMSWDNYSYRGWHIDHIKPCVLFDLTDIKQRRECFHYSNLQPLWMQENLSKNDFYLESQLDENASRIDL